MNKYKPKFILSYLLYKSRLGKHLKFSRHGIKYIFSISRLSMNMFADKNYIKRDIDLMNLYINEGETVIDVGANIGTWSLYASKLVGSKGQILCFEPHPLHFNILERNIKLNNFKNLSVYNVGLSNEVSNLYFSNNLDTMNHILLEKSADSIVINVNKLDDYTFDLNKIDLLKIDIEGYELFCLQGGINTLKKTRKIIFESSSSLTSKFGYSNSEVIKLLSTLNFSVYKTDDFNRKFKLNNDYDYLNHEDLIAFNDNYN